MLVVELNGVQFGSIPLHYIRFGIVKTIVNISLFFWKKREVLGKMLLSSFMDSLSFSLFPAVWLVV